MRTIIISYVFICLTITSLPSKAADLKSEKSQQLAQQLVRSINQKLTEIAELELAAGVKPENIIVELSQQQRFDSGRFGAILAANTQGKVISVTPKSPAYQLGLQSGDVILAVNKVAITQDKLHWFSQLQNAENNSEVLLTVQRAEKEISLKGKFQAKYTPQWQLNSSTNLLLDEQLASNLNPITKLKNNASINEENLTDEKLEKTIETSLQKGCGRVISGKTFSNKALDRFEGLTAIAVINNIDGKPIIRNKTRHRLAVGRHALSVGSLYNDNASGTKLALTIEANTNYYIANVVKAKWQDAQGNDINKTPYSGPVVFKTRKESCEL